ncbi:hypothetical protein F5Y10DRAFT_293942 [Nemania abortiva]|nr:hypothetical protein F5Y10DRAFT_293942 [Nemania abortiva]
MVVDENIIRQGGSVTISNLAAACAGLFEESQSIPALNKDDWARKSHVDFYTWASSVGAFSRYYESLDYRLRDSDDSRLAIVLLLKTIKSRLQHCSILPPTDLSREAKSDPNAPSSDSEDLEAFPWHSYDSDSDKEHDVSKALADPTLTDPFAEEMKKIDGALYQLRRITFFIQGSEASSGIQKADWLLTEGDYPGFKWHLKFLILYWHRKRHAEAWRDGWKDMVASAADPSQLDQIQNRLIWANVIRRNRICHATGVTGDQETQFPQAAPMSEWEPAATKLAERESHLSKPVEAAEQANDGADHTPTGFNPTVLNPYDNKWRPSPPSKATDIAGKQDYPCPPRGGKDPFMCPFCNQSLPAGYVRDTRRWRGHAQRDLLPYTCVLPGCSTPYELYASRLEWWSHLLDMHSTPMWICNICLAESVPTQHRFSSDELWKHHMETVHPGFMAPSHFPLLAPHSWKPSLPLIACPLCGLRESSEAKTFDHIAAHLHDFALRSLPWVSNNSDVAEGYDSYSESDDTKGTQEKQAKKTHSVSKVDDTGDEELFVPLGPETLQSVMGTILGLLSSAQDCHLQYSEEFIFLQETILIIQEWDLTDMLEDNMDAYTRPLLRILRILECLFGSTDGDTFQEMNGDLMQSYVEECASLLQAIMGDNKLQAREHEIRPGNLTSTPIADNDESMEPPGSASKSSYDGEDRDGSEEEVSESPSASQNSRGALKPWFTNPKMYDLVEKCQSCWQSLFNKLLGEWINSPSNSPQHNAAIRFAATSRYTAHEAEYQIMEAGSAGSVNNENDYPHFGLSLHAFRGFGRRASDPRTFLGLLAEPGLISSVCNAIVLMITIMIRTSNIAEECVSILDSVQEAVSTRLISMIEKQPGDRLFYQAICRLYQSVIVLLSASIRFILDEGSWGIEVSFAKKRMRRLEADMKRRYEEVRTKARRLEQSKIRSMQETFIHAGGRLGIRESTVTQMQGIALVAPGETIPSFSLRAMSWFRGISNRLGIPLELGQMHSLIAKDVWDGLSKEISDKSTTTKIISYFRKAAESSMSDYAIILDFARLSSQETRKVTTFMSHPKLYNFLCEQSESPIRAFLVNGDCRSRNKPLTYACGSSLAMARLVHGLYESDVESPEHTGTNTIIAFFCGFRIHQARGKPQAPRDILTRLIAQLIGQQSNTGIWDRGMLQRCRRRIPLAGIDGLCDLFQKLVYNMPARSHVTCFVDSVDTFMTSANNSSDVMTIVKRFVGLSMPPRNSEGPDVRVLFTTARSPRQLIRFFAREQILDLKDVNKMARAAFT